ncbi:MAG: ABC transporter ATP-binding protein [Armatimonadota bacterium]|nr:ABC transporter ATP-binding protein [bacterium]
MAEAIMVQGLKKVYKGALGDSVAAVDDLNFQVDQGQIFGFIGPNGAGKTTTIKMLLGLLFPSSGKAMVLGKPAGDIEAKKRISYLPESPYFYEHMTGVEVLDFYCKLFRMDGATRKRRIAELLEQVGLTQDGKRSLRQYSKGMLQRIGVAQALINDPDLLFLDEPTSGLDPIAHKDIQDLIFSLKQRGKSVFVSSHQLSDIESVCDRVAIINRGKLVKIGSMEELLHIGRTVITVTKAKENLSSEVKPLAERVSVDGEFMRIYVDNEENVHNVLDTVRGKCNLVSVVPQRQTLEDLFVEIVREARK